MLSSFSYSALAAACFSAAVRVLGGSTTSSSLRLSACLWRSSARARSTSRGSAPLLRGGGDREKERRRRGGARLWGDGERDSGDRLRAEVCDWPSVAGSGEGRRTADCRTAAMLGDNENASEQRRGCDDMLFCLSRASTRQADVRTKVLGVAQQQQRAGREAGEGFWKGRRGPAIPVAFLLTTCTNRILLETPVCLSTSVPTQSHLHNAVNTDTSSMKFPSNPSQGRH